METISYTSLRKNLSAVMDKVTEDHTVCYVTRKDHPSIVMISEDDYNAMKETLYLLSNPMNASALQESIKQAEAKDFVDVDWKHGRKMD